LLSVERWLLCCGNTPTNELKIFFPVILTNLLAVGVCSTVIPTHNTQQRRDVFCRTSATAKNAGENIGEFISVNTYKQQ
jgi:hypothetical protein